LSQYREILQYLFSQLPIYQRIGPAAYKTDLTNTIELCRILGDPHNNFKSIHIAGTNGKGSVAHFIASILQEAGLKVGLYTSPHLKDFRERIRINGKMITKKYVVDFVENYQTDFEKIKPSFFEMTVGMAFKYFSDKEVEIAVLETGLGGRLDSTNIVDPELSVITNIGYDHMRFLGDNPQSIAKEKAGIIKPGRPVVIGETQGEIKGVFIGKASETGSEIYFSDSIYRCLREKEKGKRKKDFFCEDLRIICEKLVRPLADLREKEKFAVCSLQFADISDICIPLQGAYQVKNVVTAICAMGVLNSLDYQIDDDDIKYGIEKVVENTGIRGRWEIISENPLTICDMGHNREGIAAVVNQINNTSHRHLHFVFGMVDDKNVQDILVLLPENATYYFCRANIPRGMNQEKLAAAAAVAGLKGESYSSVKEALGAAQQNAIQNDLVFVGGSTFVVAEVI